MCVFKYCLGVCEGLQRYRTVYVPVEYWLLVGKASFVHC